MSSEFPVRGIFFRDQADHLKRAGHKVGILAIEPRSRWTLIGRKAKWTVEEEAGIPTVRIGMYLLGRILPGPLSLSAQLYLLEHDAVQAFQSYCKSYGRPEVIHAHSAFPGGYLAACLRRRFRIPTVLTEHHSDYLRGDLPVGRLKVLNNVMNETDMCLAVSSALATAMNRLLTKPVDIGIVPNCVDTDFFRLPVEQQPFRPFRFTAIGGLNSNKNFQGLIDAFSKAFHGPSESILTVAGEGPDHKALWSLAESLKLSQRIDFPGSLNRAAVRDLIQRSHVVVSTSEFETFGVTLIEAMSCGKPVIATKSGGPNSIVTPRNGILIPTNDEDALVEAMLHVRANYHSYSANAIRDQCQQHYSATAIVKKLEAVYSTVIGDSPAWPNVGASVS